MKLVLACMSFLFLLASCNSKQTTSNTTLIKKAFTDKDEKVYLENFPHTFGSFKTTFGWNEKADEPYPLYKNANQYIDYYFELITKKYPANKKDIIAIAVDGSWQADGVNYFLNRLHKLVETDKSIGPILNALNDNQLNSFWRFYFSKEKLTYPAQLNSVLDERIKAKSMAVFKLLQKANSSTNKIAGYEVYDNDGFTNLRKGNNSASQIIGKVNTGEHINVLDKKTNWWYVQTNEGTGYIHKSRIRLGRDEDKTQQSVLCTYNPVSAKFNFSIIVTKYSNDGKKPVEINIAVSGKSNSSPPVNITFRPEYWINNSCSATSYIGRSNTNEGIENYNKFIVADYNFDGLEDFAIVNYEGGNGGPRYTYFFQDVNNHFIKNKAFPLQDGFFPKKIDNQNKTLTISGPVGCCKISTTVYQLKAKDQWATVLTKEDKM